MSDAAPIRNSPQPRKKPSDKNGKKDENTPVDETFTGNDTDPNMREDEKKDEKKEDKKDEKKEGLSKESIPGGAGKDDKFRKSLFKLVDNLQDPKYGKEYFPFSVKGIVRVLVEVKEIFKKEPVLVECRLPIVVVGDIHGQFPDLQRVFSIFSDKDRIGCFNQRYVFLGDYVDRGKQSLECIMLVFVLKILFPTEFILLRGNHEVRVINMAYGFLAELEERFERKKARELFQFFNQVFSFMPLCCIAGDTIFCMHGGICPEMTTREVFKGIPKPLMSSGDHPVAESLLWADPMYGEPRSRPNAIRGLGVHFGEALVDEICENLGVKLIVRGHQMMMNGFKFFNGHKLVTIFSASHYYPDKLNHGAVMVVDATGRCGFRIIMPSSRGEKMFRGEHENANAHDNGYQTNPDIIRAALMERARKEGSRRRKAAAAAKPKE